MDNLIVLSNSAEDHQTHLTRLLEVLSVGVDLMRENTFISRKIAWACQYVRFLARLHR